MYTFLYIYVCMYIHANKSYTRIMYIASAPEKNVLNISPFSKSKLLLYKWIFYPEIYREEQALLNAMVSLSLYSKQVCFDTRHQFPVWIKEEEEKKQTKQSKFVSINRVLLTSCIQMSTPIIVDTFTICHLHNRLILNFRVI